MEKRFSIRVACYLILIENNKILLQLRDNTNYMQDSYGVPSGHLEENEGVTKCMIREVKEEIGIDIKKEDLELKYVLNRKSSAEYICLFFTAKKYVGIPKIMETDKCKELKFFDIDNLPNNLVPELKQFLNDTKNGNIFGETDY